MTQPTADKLLWMYETMLLIRRYEETMAEVYLEGKLPPRIQQGLAFDIASGPVPGEMHLAAGQEPVAVGVCAHLTDADTVVGTHRPHHIAIAKGVPLDRMTAEIFGKQTGLGRGKGGHMHLFDPGRGFSCSGIVARVCPRPAGAALAAKMLVSQDVAVAFFGEGAANQGTFHESLNLAALWHLPAISSARTTAGPSRSPRTSHRDPPRTPSAPPPTGSKASRWIATTPSPSTTPRGRRSPARVRATGRRSSR